MPRDTLCTGTVTARTRHHFEIALFDKRGIVLALTDCRFIARRYIVGNVQLNDEEGSELHSILEAYFLRTPDGDRTYRKWRVSLEATNRERLVKKLLE